MDSIRGKEATVIQGRKASRSLPYDRVENYGRSDLIECRNESSFD